MLTYLIWFVLGALLHAALQKFFRVNNKAEQISICVSLYILGRVIKALYLDIKKSIDFKHSALKNSNLPDDVIKNVIESDKEFILEVKKSIFTTVALNLPKRYIALVPIYFLPD